LFCRGICKLQKNVQSAIELDNNNKVEPCVMIANDMVENYQVNKLFRELIKQTLA
jgi:hypothetical protein